MAEHPEHPERVEAAAAEEVVLVVRGEPITVSEMAHRVGAYPEMVEALHQADAALSMSPCRCSNPEDVGGFVCTPCDARGRIRIALSKAKGGQ